LLRCRGWNVGCLVCNQEDRTSLLFKWCVYMCMKVHVRKQPPYRHKSRREADSWSWNGGRGVGQRRRLLPPTNSTPSSLVLLSLSLHFNSQFPHDTLTRASSMVPWIAIFYSQSLCACCRAMQNASLQSCICCITSLEPTRTYAYARYFRFSSSLK